MRFSWSAPFTLNISDMEPDILHYVVYIIRDDGHNETVNTTDTHYELQADPCQSHQYHVEIAAVNVVGEGEKYRSPAINLEGNQYHLFIMFETLVIRESVDSLCRDGAGPPIVCVHWKSVLTRERSCSKPFWTPSYPIPTFLYPMIPPR